MSGLHFSGRRLYRDSSKRAAGPSRGNTLDERESESENSKSQWLTAKPASSSSHPLRRARLAQEKLIFPGEAGSGIATPRGSASAPKKTRTTSSDMKDRTLPRTLDPFLLPRKALTPSLTPETSNRARTSAGKGKAALTLVPSSNSHKAKAPAAHVVENESQVEFIGCSHDLVHPNDQQQRHSNVDATTSSDAGRDLGPDRSGHMSAITGPASHSGGRVTQEEIATYVLPPMPLPVPQFLRSIFGFGELPPPQLSKINEPVNKRKRKRAVVESSSPVKSTTLVGPSSPALSADSDLAATANEAACILAAEAVQPSPALHSSSPSHSTSVKDRAPGHGDRIAWETQDENEYRRLNRTESERLIDEQLIVRRAPREALPATQERTDYMDRFRSESYSPVQYTATEGQMNEFRRRMGLSPIQKLPSQNQRSADFQSITKVWPMKELDNETTQVSTLHSQHRTQDESFDESATQQSTCSGSLDDMQNTSIKDSKADDSGFVGSSPRLLNTSSSPAADARLRYALSRARIETGKERSSSLSPISPGCPLSIEQRKAANSLNDPAIHTATPLNDSTSSSEQDSDSDFDESTVLSKRERRILAVATQETQDLETQFIRIQETQLVPCSQEESSELEMDENMDDDQVQAAAAETMKVAKAPIAGNPGSIARSSVRKQIDAAWFPKVLESVTSAASSKCNQQEQSILTDFFVRRPGGPADKASAERKVREEEFAKAVVKERREGRQRKLKLEALVDGHDDAIEAIVDYDLGEAGKCDVDEVREVEDSDTDEAENELGSQPTSEPRLPCEGWVLGQKRHKTPTPVKQFRYRP